MSDTLPPVNDKIRYVYVVGPKEDEAPEVEDFNERLFIDEQEAKDYCYFHNVSIQAARAHKFGQTARQYQVYTVPITIHWGDLH